MNIKQPIRVKKPHSIFGGNIGCIVSELLPCEDKNCGEHYVVSVLHENCNTVTCMSPKNLEIIKSNTTSSRLMDNWYAK